MRLKNKLILIVDNDDLTLKMLDIFFKSTGATVLLEKDCKSASSLVDQTTPDVIILNIKGVDMDDSEHCRQIKEKFCKVPATVIVTSTISARQFEEKASALRAIHYFQKPYPLSDLLNRTCEVLKPSLTPNQAITFH